jgi:hypothetical protein
MQSLSSPIEPQDQIPITGRQLKRLGRCLDPESRALLGAEIQSGTYRIRNFTSAQMCALIGDVSTGYLSTAKKLSAAERSAVHCGTKQLSRIHNAYRADQAVVPTKRLSRIYNAYRADQAVVRIIDRYGASAVLSMLDRLSAPTVEAAE